MIQILSNYGDLLLRAMGQTLLLALCGLLFGTLLGMIFGILSVVKNKVCNVIAMIFVDVVRGVPMIVLAFFVFWRALLSQYHDGVQCNPHRIAGRHHLSGIELRRLHGGDHPRRHSVCG